MRNKNYLLPLLAVLFLVRLFPAVNAYGSSVSVNTPGETSAAPTLENAREIFGVYNEDPGKIDEAIALTEGLLKRDPGNVTALVFLSRVWLTYGYVKARSKEELIRVFENGKNAAEKAIGIEPGNADAHFFYVANLASLGDTKGLFNSLFMLPEVRRELETVLELDPNHVNGLAMTGALYLYLPSMLGGDLHISEVYLKRSVSLDPHVSSAGLYLAANLKRQKKYDEALEVLNGILNDRNPSFYPDWVENRKYAYMMIRGIRQEMDGGTAKKDEASTLN
ncbi:MAG: tetratricopeptide repeat protein [Thermodesulfobacteriota bacterium]